MSLDCGVLPAWRSAHQGQSLRARTLMAVTDAGEVVASAYAAAYISDGSDQARQECFWGMLATHPEWRGRGLSLALGGGLLRQMREGFGFTRFYTGVVPGNMASEAVCRKLGQTTGSDSIVTTVDAAQLPGGRMTK
jgi:RimJ/RimL family protein N-acetyltransferase